MARLEPAAPLSRVKHSTNEPLPSLFANSEDPYEMQDYANYAPHIR